MEMEEQLLKLGANRNYDFPLVLRGFFFPVCMLGMDIGYVFATQILPVLVTGARESSRVQIPSNSEVTSSIIL